MADCRVFSILIRLRTEVGGMARAYRHMGLGSPKQVIYFCHQRLYELREHINALKDEMEMWGAIDRHLAGDIAHAEAIRISGTSQYELVQQLNRAQRDQVALELLMHSYQPCPACRGAGEIRFQIDQDSSETKSCVDCNGTGQTSLTSR